MKDETVKALQSIDKTLKNIDKKLAVIEKNTKQPTHSINGKSLQELIQQDDQSHRQSRENPDGDAIWDTIQSAMDRIDPKISIQPREIGRISDKSN